MKYQYWNVPLHIAAETERAFLVGRHEVFAIWAAPRLAGVKAGADISRFIVPAQTPGVTPDGVWVHIDGAELQRIQLDNFRRAERSVVQLHTHPGADVRMSSLDRKWEVVRHVGALSIIVPHYGTKGLLLHDAANVYEREEDDWRLWSREEARKRLVVQ
jgi:hypothetical protein